MMRLLEWDSEFFGQRIARLEVDDLEPQAAALAEAWCREQAIDCAYLLVGVADQAGLDRARAHGFRLVDLRVTLETATTAAGRPAPIRVAVPADLAQLQAIARAGHRDGRFHADGHFAAARCDEFYATWIANSCAGWADRVFVIDEGAGANGYLTLHKRADQGAIGLLGVGSDVRGRGLGTCLLTAAQDWCAQHGLSRLTVVTQGRNQAALRLYQSAGFRVTGLQLWHHRWFSFE